MSLLGKVYLGVSLALLLVGAVWASNTLQANAAWVEIVLAVPRADLIEPLQRIRYEVNLAIVLLGWVVAATIAAVYAIRAPFKIRIAALTQRRIRELEREVLELRTLPLRQQEEDAILAEEAHLEPGTKKVMTEKIRRDELVAPTGREGGLVGPTGREGGLVGPTGREGALVSPPGREGLRPAARGDVGPPAGRPAGGSGT